MKARNYLLFGLVLSSVLGLTACGSSASSADGSVSEVSDAGRSGGGTTTPTVTATSGLWNHPGKLLASNCFQCHGTNGTGGFDDINGDSVSEFIKEMNELKVENDMDEAIMKVHALSYTDAEIALMADYFSKVR